MNGAVMNPGVAVRLTFGTGGIPILGEVVDGGRIVWYGRCQLCGCTEENCQGCIDRTGEPCFWANAQRTICSACVSNAFALLAAEESDSGAVPNEEDCTP